MKLQISIRELMLLVCMVGLGLAGLSTGGWLASLTVLLLLTVSTAFAIVAFVGHGQHRVFAIGYLIPMFFYIVPHVYVGSSELDPYGKLPTTKLLQPVFEQLVRREYINTSTGQLVPNYGFAGAYARESPDRSEFMLLAHTLVAAALAYSGGKFAVWLNRHEPNPKSRNESGNGGHC